MSQLTDEADERAPALDTARRELLERVERWLETPMLVLAFVWLVLLIIELTRGLSPLLEAAGAVIWIVFVVDFSVRFILAPDKTSYLRANWLTAIALVMPALRTLRIVRALRILRFARASRGLRLVRVVTSLNRGMRALGASMGRRGFGYVAVLTVVVTVAGAAGMYAFERDAPEGGGLQSYGEALWWTGMMMTTMGSQYWPYTAEGRVLCFLLALYAFAVFGYMTASLATFFVGRDAEDEQGELASAKAIAQLRAEIAALRAEVTTWGLNQSRG